MNTTVVIKDCKIIRKPDLNALLSGHHNYIKFFLNRLTFPIILANCFILSISVPIFLVSTTAGSITLLGLAAANVALSQKKDSIHYILDQRSELAFTSFSESFLLLKQVEPIDGLMINRKDTPVEQQNLVADYALPRCTASLKYTSTSILQCSIPFPSIQVAGITLDLLPDAILKKENQKAQAYPYSDLKVTYRDGVYLEERKKIPETLEVIGYIEIDSLEEQARNKLGNTETQIPMCLYAYLDFELENFVFTLMVPCLSKAKSFYEFILLYQQAIL